MIYLDYAASTPPDKEIFNRLKGYYIHYYANPSAPHFFGKQIKNILESNREELARILNIKPTELVFCSGGTEANNLAIFGSVYASRTKGKHIISTAVEHKSVLASLAKLEAEGYTITYLLPDINGLINLDDLKRALKKDTILISILLVNNETGVIQPYQQISQIVREFNEDIVIFYDIVAGFTKVINDLKKIDADLLTISGHKLYAPKGTGILYIKNGTKILPQILGGEHERGFRAGTENFPSIIFLCESIKKCLEEREKVWKRLENLKQYFEQVLSDKFGDNIMIAGKNAPRIPHISNICFKNHKSHEIIDKLSKYKICVASGSACKEHSGISHVLSAMGIPESFAEGAIRFSFGRFTTKKEIDKVIKILNSIIKI